MNEPTRLPVTLESAHRLAVAHLGEFGLTDQSNQTFLRLWARFVAFATNGLGVTSIDEIDAELVGQFVDARRGSGDIPALATMHHRRSAIRLLYKVWRQFDLTEADPTIGIEVPPRSRLAIRPLTNVEVAICRVASLATPTATRQPAIWALAEAGVQTAEIPFVAASDVDLCHRTVRVQGSTKTEPRTLRLGAWGGTQLARRIDALADKSASLGYDGNGSPGSGQASVAKAIATILRRAGLENESDIAPRSIAAWVASSVFDSSARIEDVAYVLGLRSLDRAAELVSWDWREHAGTNWAPQ